MPAINTENYRITADRFSDGTVKLTVLSGGTWSPLGVLNLPSDPDVLPTVIELLKVFVPAKAKQATPTTATTAQATPTKRNKNGNR